MTTKPTELDLKAIGRIESKIKAAKCTCDTEGDDYFGLSCKRCHCLNVIPMLRRFLANKRATEKKKGSADV